MAKTTRLALLWHMHQPMYVAPATGEAILPWVRLHATHAYLDMARMLERHAGVRATVNFVPSLLEQLEGAATGRMPERYLEATRARPEAMSAELRAFVVRQFFMVNPRVMATMPRYLELAARRDADAAGAGGFGDGDVRDLQVLFNLAWMGFSARREDDEVARLVAKGRGYDEQDKAALVEAQQRILGRLVPMWQALAQRGGVELSTTPYFHPILPIVCDSDSARRAMPGATLPPRFAHPDDAREQVRRSLALHARLFGRAPAGMWPAEGSVSPEAAEVFAEAGVRWVATDEGVLERSSPPPARRGAMYQPHLVRAGARDLAVVFRDRGLSDRVGFSYASMEPAAAVSDFVERVRRAGADARAAGVGRPLVAVVLDGENAWEHFAGHGEAFLSELYAALESSPDIETTTMSEAVASPGRRLESLHSGSWIESNFRIWIGHEEDNLGWSLLGDVRGLYAAHAGRGDVPADRLAAAYRLLLAAEGSDWFWWYGDDFETANAAEFDQLFRDHLIEACVLLGEPPPARLRAPLSRRAREASGRGVADVRPSRRLRVPDARRAAFADWVGAGVLRPATGRGSMYRASGGLERVEFGLDGAAVRVRILGWRADEGAAVGVELDDGRIVVLRGEAGGVACEPAGAGGAAGRCIEVRLPVDGPSGRAAAGVRIWWQAAGSTEREPLPEQGFVPLAPASGDEGASAWLV